MNNIMKKNIYAIFFAILAAALYAINIPISKLLLNHISPTILASLLYLGAGLGIGIVYLFTNKNKKEKEEKFTRKDLPYIIGMIFLDIVAPILLMFGLLNSASSNASLLNNFEIVCTSLIALFIFKEAISKKMWVAIILITLSSFVLSIKDITSFKFSWGALLVLLATLSWGFENNCTRNLSSKNTYKVVFIKGIFSGLGSLIVAILLKETFNNPENEGTIERLYIGKNIIQIPNVNKMVEVKEIHYEGTEEEWNNVYQGAFEGNVVYNSYVD